LAAGDAGGAGGGRAACACCMTREHSIETAATDRAPPSVQIRHHAPADRAALTAPLDDKAWRAALASYLSALNYPEPAPAPGDVSGEAAVADWLLGRAVALAAADAGAARLAPAVAAAVEAGAAVLDAPETTTAPPFADLEAPATADAVAALADAVGAPPGPLPARLAATEALLTDRLLPAAALTGAGGGAAPDAALLAAAPLGFSTGDPAADRAAVALRWLYVRDLAALQAGVDAAIAGVQEVTANPKTDTRLGKVGR